MHPGAHGVFHLAGVVDHSRLSAPYVYRVNVEGTRNVMIAAGTEPPHSVTSRIA